MLSMTPFQVQPVVARPQAIPAGTSRGKGFNEPLKTALKP